ncbi:MAG: hypothetical protein J6A52_01505 [Bacilli bacterium]|nr:hypothetical protein [Bacilli bacterium]
MNGSVKVDSASLKTLSQNLIIETEKLLQMIDVASEKVEGSNAFFDSMAAQQFRAKMLEYSMNIKKSAGTTLSNLSSYFDSVANIYDTLDTEVAEVANQFLSMDIFDNL